MSYIYYNPNPDNRITGDCVVRALSKLFNCDWDTAYMMICLHGAEMHDMPQVNEVWSNFLETRGYTRYKIEDTCPYCYTLKDFCYDHPTGRYFVSIDVGYADLYSTADSGIINGNHVVTVLYGNYYDAWDSGNEVPIFYWTKERR